MRICNKKEKIILFIMSLVLLLIRFLWIDKQSDDYIYFLNPWIEQIKNLGGLSALKFNIGDYNVPYLFLLIIISYLKCEPLIPIKILSIIFDFVCAIMSSMIIYKITKNKFISMIGYIVIFALPTVLFNGSMWAQCDSIYTSFILISLYYLIDEKYTKSFVFLGVAFAFKLQFIFILPMYILLLFRKKEIKIYHFLLIPAVNFICCLPAIISGRNIVDIMLIYFNQTGTYSDLVMNFPNIYNLVNLNVNFANNFSDIITLIGIGVTLLIYVSIWLFVLVKKIDFNFEKILTVGLWSIMIATYFLPRMHDRYLFVADILSVIWFIIYKKKFYVPIMVNFVSFITYLKYLLYISIIDYRIIAILYFCVILLFTIHVFKLLNQNNDYN